MSDVVRFVSEAATTARLRRDWFNELIRWCKERGIKTDTAIAAYLKINRSTLHRWKWGTPPTPANIAVIVEKTFGDIDPRMPARRAATNMAAVHERVEKVVLQSLEMAATSRARNEAAKELNERFRIDLDESLRALRGNGNGGG